MRLYYLFAVGIVLALAGSYVSNARLVDNLGLQTLTARSEASADSWVRHFSTEIGGFDHIIATGSVTGDEMSMLDEARSFVDVFRFKIFDDQGRLILVSDNISSDGVEFSGDDETNATALKTLASGLAVTVVQDGRAKDNRPDWYAESYVPLLDAGRIVGVAEIYVDVAQAHATITSGFRQLSVAQSVIMLAALAGPAALIVWFIVNIKGANSSLDRARRKAQSAENAKGRFLANMSHEIRTPMNGVIGMAELLSETRLDPDQATYANTIVNSATALLNIINDVLDFSKIEAGKLEIIEAPFDLHASVQDAAALLAPVASAKGLEICVDFREPLPCWVEGDGPRLRQCLLNLLGNAVKFTDSGVVELSAGRSPDGRLVIDVRDTGRGIAPDKLDSVFRDFEQVEDADTRATDGTGLGLAITQRLVTLMQGEISLTSVPGTGSTFTLSLPFRAAPVPAGAGPVDADCLHGLKALVVDDLDTNRRILTARLASLGITATTAASVDDAMASVTSGAALDLVVTDDNMPGKSGADLIAALQADPDAKGLPVVVLTSGDLQASGALSAGGKPLPVLHKPVRSDLLVDALLRAVGHSRVGVAAPGATPMDGLAEIATLRVGVAEDNRTNQLLINSLLGPLVADLTIWADGQEAVDRAADWAPDVILMDMSMPRLDGLAATRALRRQERDAGRQPVPIIALTANAMAEDRTSCLEAGMTGFLSKPVRKAELVATLAGLAAPSLQLPG